MTPNREVHLQEPKRAAVPVSEIVDGERFRWDDGVWEADVHHTYVVAFREGGFGARVTFYDPVTAAKAGALSWATLVERL